MKSCPICRSDKTGQLKPVNGFDVFKCRNCKLIWVPGVSSETISNFYSREYFRSKDATLGYHDYLEDEEIIRINARYILSNMPAPRNSDSRILDVGCAYGFLLDEARKRGWSPHGVELNKEAVEYAAGRLKLNAINTTLENAPFPDGFFENAVIIGSIEHFADPFSVIDRVNRLMQRGTPCHRPSIPGPVRLYDIKPPEHLYYFLRTPGDDAGIARVQSCQDLPYWCHYHFERGCAARTGWCSE